MKESRKRRAAKQNRRARKSPPYIRDGDILVTTIRKALAKHPVHLLSLASQFISRAKSSPDPSKGLRDGPPPLKGVIVNLGKRRCRETTALLAAFAELLLDDDVLRERCRQEVATRRDHLPRWIVGLSHGEVRRVVRRSDALGDRDELSIALLLPGAHALTLRAVVDHNVLSSVTDFAVLMGPLDKVLAPACEKIDPADAFVEMSPADARSWLERGIDLGERLPQADGWRDGLPLVKWLLAHLPDGGTAYEGPEWDDDAICALLDGFFASPAGAPFTDLSYRDVLSELCDTGSGDPSRWSTRRITSILRYPFHDDRVALEIALDAPAILRAFVPFAHAHSGVRKDLTDDAITTIDQLSLRYRRALLDTALDHDDREDEALPWHIYPDRAS